MEFSDEQVNVTVKSDISNLIEQQTKSENMNIVTSNKLTREEQEIGLYIESQDDLTIKI